MRYFIQKNINEVHLILSVFLLLYVLLISGFHLKPQKQMCWNIFRFFFNFNFFNVYFCVWERKSVSGGEAWREGDTESKQAVLTAQSPKRCSNPQTPRSWPGQSRTLNRLTEPPRCHSVLFFFLKKKNIFVNLYFSFIDMNLENLAICKIVTLNIQEI